MNATRIDHVRELFIDAGVDAILISSTSNITYLSGFDRFLLPHDGFLFVTKEQVFLITSPLYTQAVKLYTPDLEVLETTPDIWYATHISQVAKSQKIQRIGFEEEDLRVAEYFDIQETGLTLKAVSLRSLRVHKDQQEIACIEKASQVTDKTFTAILPFVKEGVSEKELSDKMSDMMKQFGGEVGFPSIVAFGPHSSIPHHMTSDAALEKNMFVLFDFGASVEHYMSDMSRTVFFGKPTDAHIVLYEAVQHAQQEVITSLEKRAETIEVHTLDAIARKTIEEKGLPAYPHALGHGVGLEVHEAPTISAYAKGNLPENSVFTIEPGSYSLALGGVRIEDVFLFKEKKLRQLTTSPKDLIVL